MYKYIFVLIIAAAFISCNNQSKNEPPKDNRISLQRDTINVVKPTDTLVIFESTCRGCAYEGSTNFSIDDSLGVVKLTNVITTDNNSPDMAGGSVSKQLVIVPLKAGTTTFRMYKFWSETKTAKDSANSVMYTVTVKN
jgi:hypothetical protein